VALFTPIESSEKIKVLGGRCIGKRRTNWLGDVQYKKWIRKEKSQKKKIDQKKQMFKMAITYPQSNHFEI